MAPWIKQNSQLTKNSESNELDCSLWDLTANEKGTSQVPGTGHRDDGHWHTSQQENIRPGVEKGDQRSKHLNPAVLPSQGLCLQQVGVLSSSLSHHQSQIKAEHCHSEGHCPSKHPAKQAHHKRPSIVQDARLGDEDVWAYKLIDDHKHSREGRDFSL